MLTESFLFGILRQHHARGVCCPSGSDWGIASPPVPNPQMCEELQITNSKWPQQHLEHCVELPPLVPLQYKHSDRR